MPPGWIGMVFRMKYLRQLFPVLGLLCFGAALAAIRLQDPAMGPATEPATAGAQPRAPGEVRRITVGSSVYSMAFSPDGRAIAAGCADRTVRIFDSATGEQVHRLLGHNSAITSLAFSSDGTRLASAGGLGRHGLFLWNMAKGRPIESLEPFDGWVSCVAFSPDGKSLLAGCGMGYLAVGRVAWWDLSTGQLRRRLDGQILSYPDMDGIGGIAMAPDGSGVLVANYTLRLWSSKTHRDLRRFEQRESSEPPLVRCVAFTHDSRNILGGGLRGELSLWDATTGRIVRRFEGHADDVCSVALSGDDALAASCGFDGTVRLWEISTGRERRQFAGHQGVVWAVTISPDNLHIASAGNDGTIRFWPLH